MLRASSLVIAMTLLASATAQQLVVSQNDNLSYGNYAVGWPSSVIAFRFTLPQATTLAAAQVFTGNQAAATHTVEIRQRDPVTGLPTTAVGQGGSWQSVHARSWQGAVFAQPAVLAANTDYFLVWSVGGMFPQHSVSADGNPANVLSEARYSDGNSWHAQGMVAAKFRLFTASASGLVTPIGSGKPGVAGIPTIGVNGWAAVGSPIDVWLDQAARVASTAPPNALLAVGWPIPGGITWPIGTQYTTAEAIVLAQTRSHSSPFVGATSFTLAVPALPALAGLTVAFQWAVFDAAAQDGLAHTAAVAVTLQ